MPVFSYQVVDKSGAALTGKIEAEHEWVAADRLRRMGYLVVDITRVGQPWFPGAFQVRRKVSMGELGMFSRQLAAMIGAGIPLTRGLYALSEQAVNPTLAGVVRDVARNVEGGLSLSESLNAYPEVFSKMYVDMVRAGEVGGKLEEVLYRLSEQLEREKSLRDSIRGATLYPLAVIGFSACVLLVMLFVVVPIFIRFFPEGVPLPLPTRIIIAFSNSLRLYWYLYLLAALLLVLTLRFWLTSGSGRRAWDRVSFRLPLVGALIQKTVVARFCRTLSTLLAGGIPVLRALEAAGPAAGNLQVADAVRTAAERIQQGQSIAVPLKQAQLFPPMVTLMIAVGEESGELPGLLGRIADFYETEVSAMVKGLASLIEPLLIIVVGSLVGLTVISLYLPIFTVVTSIGR